MSYVLLSSSPLILLDSVSPVPLLLLVENSPPVSPPPKKNNPTASPQKPATPKTPWGAPTPRGAPAATGGRAHPNKCFCPGDRPARRCPRQTAPGCPPGRTRSSWTRCSRRSGCSGRGTAASCCSISSGPSCWGARTGSSAPYRGGYMVGGGERPAPVPTSLPAPALGQRNHCLRNPLPPAPRWGAPGPASARTAAVFRRGALAARFPPAIEPEAAGSGRAGRRRARAPPCPSVCQSVRAPPVPAGALLEGRLVAPQQGAAAGGILVPGVVARGDEALAAARHGGGTRLTWGGTQRGGGQPGRAGGAPTMRGQPHFGDAHDDGTHTHLGDTHI